MHPKKDWHCYSESKRAIILLIENFIINGLTMLRDEATLKLGLITSNLI